MVFPKNTFLSHYSKIHNNAKDSSHRYSWSQHEFDW